MKARNCLAAGAVVLLVGCATQAKDIQASYVSPVLYQNLTCEQLALEAQSVSSRVGAAQATQNKKANQDAAAMAVGLVVFWPALLFTQGDGAAAAEVGRLKGEMQAIETASNQKSCGIVFAKEPARKICGTRPDSTVRCE